MKLPEFFFHDGCILRDVVRGGTSGTIYCFWNMDADYDDDIAQGIKYQQWLQLKIAKKLCNNNIATNKRQDG